MSGGRADALPALAQRMEQPGRVVCPLSEGCEDWGGR